MTIELGFLRTRVARRLLVAFVISALLPLGVLATISLDTVGSYLHDRSNQRLLEVATGTERAVLDRLDLAARDVALLTDLVRGLPGDDPRTGGGGTLVHPAELGLRFPALRSASVALADDRVVSLFGPAIQPPELDQHQIRHLRTGNTLLVERGSESPPELLMARSIGEEPDQEGVVWARLDRSRLWQSSRMLAALPTVGGMCVLNADLVRLHGPESDDPTFMTAVRAALEAFEVSPSTWEGADGAQRLVTRVIALGPKYLSRDWHVVVSIPEELVTAPLREFTQAFLPVVLAAFLVVLLLSNAQIRRTIRPLEQLHDATRRIASEDFSARLDIRTRDEFRDLAHSFNRMSDRLGKQIQTLTAINHVDRAGLSARDSRDIVEAVLQTLLDVGDCETVSICTVHPHGGDRATSFAVSRDSREVTVVHDLDAAALERCVGSVDASDGPDYLILEGTQRDELPCLAIPPFGDHPHRRFAVFPLDLGDRHGGVICLASTDPEALQDEAARRLRQIADQAALALSNVDRLDALGRMSLGALTALARAIDANSPWTAGHSERVTLIATALGERIGLDAANLDILRRGGLLHDIGKIGVPVEILNKPGSLTEAEFEAVKAHVTVGHRILEPVAAYRDLIPIVRHHHERVDGQGYPDGLAGDDIALHARVVAVADTFDALTSDRPYRDGLPVKTAIEVIKNAAGTQLDAWLVEQFLGMLADGSLDLPNLKRRSASAAENVQPARRERERALSQA